MSDDLDPKTLMAALATLIAANPVDAPAAIAVSDGRPVPEKLRSLPDAVKFSIASIKFDRFGAPTITMHSKTAAIELAGRALAIWSDRTVIEDARRPPVTDHGALSGMTTQEKAEAFAAMVNSGPH